MDHWFPSPARGRIIRPPEKSQQPVRQSGESAVRVHFVSRVMLYTVE